MSDPGDSGLRSLLGFLRRTDGTVAEKTIRSGFWVALSSLVVRNLELVRSILLARLLFPEFFGLMGIVAILTRGLEVFTRPGFTAAIIYRQQDAREAADATWSVNILRGLVLAGVTFAAAPLLAGFYDEPLLLPVVRVMAVVFVVDGLRNAHLVFLRKEMDFRRLARFEIVPSILQLAIVVAAAWYYRSVWALVVGQVAASVLRTAMSFLIAPSGVPFAGSGGVGRRGSR